MKKWRVLSGILLVVLLAISLPGIALAQDENTPAETIELAPVYPKLESIAGGNFEFEVEFKYIGAEDRDFNLRATAPPGWEVYLTPPYEKEKKVSALRLSPSLAFGDKMRMVANAPFWPLPEPGEYNISLEASSGDVSATTDFKAVITNVYSMVLVPVTEQYNTEATAGKDNTFSIEVGNLGTGAIDNINFSSSKPEGWGIKFAPEKVDLLEALDSKTVDIILSPPPETIAGDYVITLKASAEQTNARDINIRVTVETPTVWGWVGVAIIILVVAGLAVVFMRFSRR